MKLTKKNLALNQKDAEKQEPKRERCVIRKSGLDDLYLQPDDTWGSFKTARRFSSQERADHFAALLGLGNYYGVFAG